MRFLLHGSIHPDTQAALIKHGDACHTTLELSEDTDAPEEFASNPALLLPLLAKKQWQLITTDTEFVQQLYEKHVQFPGIIVLILDVPDQADVLHTQANAIGRLFERYKRLSERRLYTVTPSRVKIRQLPGAAQA